MTRSQRALTAQSGRQRPVHVGAVLNRHTALPHSANRVKASMWTMVIRGLQFGSMSLSAYERGQALKLAPFRFDSLCSVRFSQSEVIGRDRMDELIELLELLLIVVIDSIGDVSGAVHDVILNVDRCIGSNRERESVTRPRIDVLLFA